MKPWPVMFYPPLLTNGDLHTLMTWSGLVLQRPSRVDLVPFCKWLREFVVTELERRQSDEIIETSMPVLPLDRFSPQTIAHVAIQMHCTSKETESENIGEFADALLDVVTVANLLHTETRKD